MFCDNISIRLCGSTSKDFTKNKFKAMSDGPKKFKIRNKNHPPNEKTKHKGNKSRIGKSLIYRMKLAKTKKPCYSENRNT